ncbi:MAG: glycosyltransferase family 2 protein [Chloroflexi bacterium]|nr:glycosyltransferase family 2 protein [Chloroflexota bacterium]
MDLSVVIVSYNVREFLSRCLVSLLRTMPAHLSSEIIVVDNASQDGSVEFVRGLFPQVQLIVNDQNRGFTAASNQGLQLARGRHLFLLNPDTLIREGAMARLIECLEKPGVAMVGPKLVYPDGRLQHSAFRFPSLMQIFLDHFPFHPGLVDSTLNGRYPRRRYEQGEPFQIDFPLGAAMLAKREALDQVGLLDEGFFMYCEEIDWSMRFRRAGWQIWCEPRAEIVHYVAQSTGQNWGASLVALHRSRFRLYQKYYSSSFQCTARGIVAAGMRKELLLARWGRPRSQERETLTRAYRQVLALADGREAA